MQQGRLVPRSNTPGDMSQRRRSTAPRSSLSNPSGAVRHDEPRANRAGRPSLKKFSHDISANSPGGASRRHLPYPSPANLSSLDRRSKRKDAARTVSALLSIVTVPNYRRSGNARTSKANLGGKSIQLRTSGPSSRSMWFFGPFPILDCTIQKTECRLIDQTSRAVIS